MIYIYRNKNGYSYIQPKFNIYGGGYYLVNEKIENKLISALPYIIPKIENDVVVSFEIEQNPLPDIYKPTEQEKLRADVDYLSVMTGVDLA